MSSAILADSSSGVVSYVCFGTSVSGSRWKRWAGVIFSFICHAVLLLIVGTALIQPVEFAVDSGLSGVEVQLVAGMDEVRADAPQVQETVSLPEEIPVAEEKEIDVPPVVQEVKPVDKITEVRKEVLPSNTKSAQLGNASFDAQAGSGARTDVLPGYLSNPAPHYPAEAKRNGWEGVTILHVTVGKKGVPLEVAVEKSSGWPILDASAVKAVRTWRFRPAQMGGVPIETSVKVPVRFELKD